MSTSKPSQRIIGILIASIATIFFAILDTSGKWLVQSFPVIEVVWVRFVVHMILALIGLIYAEGFKNLMIEDRWLHVLRSVMLCAMTGLNFFALQYLQLAQTAAILFSAPIIIALISSFVHHEKLSPIKWCAVIAGFIGVLIILDPFGYHFHPAMLLVLAHATIYALFNFLSKRIAAKSSPLVTQFYSALGPTVVLLPFLFQSWQSPSLGIEYGVFFCAGLFGFLSHNFISIAYRYATPSTIAPFFYQQMIWMVLLGWLIFDQVPTWNVYVGTLLVIGSGLYLVLHELKQGKK